MAYTETAQQFFERISHSLEPLTSVGAVIEFDIEKDPTTGNPGGKWLVDLTEGAMAEPGSKKPTVVVKARERDFMAVIEGRMSPQDGLLTERLAVAGDLAVFGRLVNALETVQTALA
jgi:putative sterol carrier protein